METKEDRQTYHACPECGEWITYWGTKKHGMGTCRNKKCTSTEVRKIEDFPTRFEHYVLNPMMRGCMVCGKPIAILPQPYGKGGPESYTFVGHFLVHTECTTEMEKILNYESKRLEKEIKHEFGNKKG